MNTEKMTDKKILDTFNKLEARSSALSSTIIALGLGSVRMSDLYRDYIHLPAVAEDCKVNSELSALHSEAERRYGNNGMIYLRCAVVSKEARKHGVY